MTGVMSGVQNFLSLLYENWTTILVCIGLIIGIVKKTIDYMSKSKDERVDIVKEQIQQTILKMISDAELEWEEWDKAGSIKRSQVIKQIYEEYPILSKVIDQTELVKWIDNQIDSALDTLRDVIKENQKETENQ